MCTRLAPLVYLFLLTHLLVSGTRAGPNGAIGWITGRLDPRVGPLHRGTAWLGVGLRAD